MNLDKFGFKPKKEEVQREIELGIDEYKDKKEGAYLEDEPEVIPLRKTNDILVETDWKEIYDSYAKAMSRRDREPLAEESFYEHFFNDGSLDETFAYGNSEKGYFLGFNKFNVFIPTHFAPKTLRGGYELVKELGDNQNIPAVMAITEDLGKTLDKMPSWKKIEISEEILSYFRGNIVKKEIYYNSSDKVKNLMVGLLSEYLNESQDRGYCEDDEKDNYDND